MNKYNPNIHHRRSIRLKGYDYSQAGLYFITICVKDREYLFGKIENNEMILNDAGIMLNKWWKKIPEKFHDIELDVYQIMPNHFHAIVFNTGIGVGANPCVRPISDNENMEQTNANDKQDAGANPCVRPISDNENDLNINLDAPTPILGEHMGSPLHGIVQWFKTMSTNEYIRGVKTLGWEPFNGKLLQRNYYEHIIRNEKSYQTIADYIVNNPVKWEDDKFYMK